MSACPVSLDIVVSAPLVLDVAVVGIQGPQGDVGAPGEIGPPGPVGPQQIFVQSLRPVQPGPWLWWQTDQTGTIIDMIVNDGA